MMKTIQNIQHNHQTHHHAPTSDADRTTTLEPGTASAEHLD